MPKARKARRRRRVKISSLQKDRRARLAALELFGIRWGKTMESPEMRQRACETLAKSNNAQLQMLAEKCSDPMFKRKSMATIATEMGIYFITIADEFQAIKRSEGLLNIHSRIPEVASQMVEAAMDKEYPCTADGCVNGLVDIPETKDNPRYGQPVTRYCKTCRGTGKITVLGDTDRLKYVLESAKMINQGGKGGGVQVNQFNLPQPNEKLEDLYGSLGPLLEGKVSE